MWQTSKKSDVVGSVIFSLVGIWAMSVSVELDLGHPTEPGPGLFPFLAAFLLTIISITLMVMALKGRTSGSKPFARLWTRPATTFAGTMIYIIVIDYIGFIISTFFLAILVLRVLGKRRWWLDVIISLALSIGGFYLSDRLLEVPLPMGTIWPAR